MFTYLLLQVLKQTLYTLIYQTQTSATINQLRLAFATQKILRASSSPLVSRYIEVIKGHFNVTSPDARLQRPQYLGGGSSPVNISPVAQTSSTDATTPQGKLICYWQHLYYQDTHLHTQQLSTAY